MKYKMRTILKNILLALLTIPVGTLAIWIALGTLYWVAWAISTGLRRFEDALAWIVPVVVFIGALIYAFKQNPREDEDRLTRKVAKVLVKEWALRLTIEGKPKPRRIDKIRMRNLLKKRLKIFRCSDPDLWSRSFPEEKYPEDISEIAWRVK